MYKLIYKLGGANLLKRLKTRRTVTVVSLHRVSDERNYFWDPLSPSVFERYCAYVKKNYHVTTFNELPHLKGNSKPPLIISFDDGYHDFMEYALGILKRHDLPCNHNIVFQCAEENMTIWTQRMNYLFLTLYRQGHKDYNLNLLDRAFTARNFNENWRKMHLTFFYAMMQESDATREAVLTHHEEKMGVRCYERMMNWDDVREAMRNGTEIGNHTYSHTVISDTTSQEDLQREIVLAGEEIKKRINAEMNVFCYPNGRASKNLLPFFGDLGYKYVLELNENLNDMRTFNFSQPVVVDRINIPGESIEKVILRTEFLQQRIKKLMP